MKYSLCTLLIISLLATSYSLANTHPETPLPRKIDSYGKINFKHEKVRLDAFVAVLKKEPDAHGYIMTYAGKRTGRNEAVSRGRRAKEYLVKHGRQDPRRIVVIDGGYREKLTVELFVVPLAAVPPVSTPTVDSN